MTSWKMNKHGKFKGRTVYSAHQDVAGGLACWPPLKFNAVARFIRKYAHIDVDLVLKGLQELPK